MKTTMDYPLYMVQSVANGVTIKEQMTREVLYRLADRYTLEQLESFLQGSFIIGKSQSDFESLEDEIYSLEGRVEDLERLLDENDIDYA